MTESNMKAPELANIEVQGMTRESFIMRGAIAAGSVYGLPPLVRSSARRWRREVGM